MCKKKTPWENLLDIEQVSDKRKLTNSAFELSFMAWEKKDVVKLLLSIFRRDQGIHLPKFKVVGCSDSRLQAYWGKCIQ